MHTNPAAQMFKQFADSQLQLLSGSSAALASSNRSSSNRSASASTSSLENCSSRSTVGTRLLRRVRGARQRWQLQLAQEQGQQQEGVAAGEDGGNGPSRSQWDAWAAPLLLTGLCWHTIDTLMW